MRYRALAERIATGLAGPRAAAIVARATTELARDPGAGADPRLVTRFLRRVIELSGAPEEAPAQEEVADATTLFGADVFQRAHERWRALEERLVALDRPEFDFFVARFQSKRSHAELSAAAGEPIQATVARERAWLDRLRRAAPAGPGAEPQR